MRIRIFPLLWLAAGLVAVPALAEDAPAVSARVVNEAAVPVVMQKAVDDFIRPGYRDLVTQAGAMAKVTRALCEAPSAQELENTKTAFDALVRQWSTIEVVRVGPVTEGNRFERFLFFPDRKGTGLKQVQRIIADADETATSAKVLNGKSVAAQGLGALEYALYGTGADAVTQQPNGFRCRYAAAIAENLQGVAGELSADWEKPNGIQKAWKHPGPDNLQFRDNNEAATELLGIFVHGVETIKDQRIRPVYTGAADKGHPKLAIYWRSGNTFPALTTNYSALQTLFAVSGMQSLLPQDSLSVARSVESLFTALIDVSGRIDVPVEQALTDEKQRERLDFLIVNTNDLLQRLNKDFGGAIGLGAGFSFADGD